MKTKVTYKPKNKTVPFSPIGKVMIWAADNQQKERPLIILFTELTEGVVLACNEHRNVGDLATCLIAGNDPSWTEFEGTITFSKD